MKTSEEIRKIAETIIPYNPYNNTFFPGQRESELSGFVRGYKESEKKSLETLKKAYDMGNFEITFDEFLKELFS